jgi:hypothetical protein
MNSVTENNSLINQRTMDLEIELTGGYVEPN